MTESNPVSAAGSLDLADDAPEWTDAMFDAAEFSVGGEILRPATGYLGKTGVVRGRPPQRGRAKQQVTLRLDPDVVERFRESGPGWQGRINEALRRVVGL